MASTPLLQCCCAQIARHVAKHVEAFGTLGNPAAALLAPQVLRVLARLLVAATGSTDLVLVVQPGLPGCADVAQACPRTGVAPGGAPPPVVHRGQR
jgi:hypothetical protein